MLKFGFILILFFINHKINGINTIYTLVYTPYIYNGYFGHSCRQLGF